MKSILFVLLVFVTAILPIDLNAQTITGAWKGKIGSVKTELKLIKKGDSLVGTSYYYTSKTRYRRYSVKGYFDPETNSVIWWDDVLLEEVGTNGLLSKKSEPYLSVADFNCPGENKMLLEGESTQKDDKDEPTGPVDMQKINYSQFSDEWDFVLENYFVGANHPDIIDSVAYIAFQPAPVPEGYEASLTPMIVKPAPLAGQKPTVINPGGSSAPVLIPSRTPDAVPVPENTPKVAISPIEKKFATRTNKLQTVIPVTAEKIELRFYDNAQVDGDSIALFLNGKLLYKNIRLTDQAYTIHINASDLQDDNELVMVAENLGSIPPNTSFMVAIVGDKRYEARLYANENSSALIRFIKQ